MSRSVTGKLIGREGIPSTATAPRAADEMVQLAFAYPTTSSDRPIQFNRSQMARKNNSSPHIDELLRRAFAVKLLETKQVP